MSAAVPIPIHQRKYGDRPSHPIYLWNGILEPKHRRAIGAALWEFIWCIDRITKEKNGVGYILSGKPVTHAEIAKNLGVSEKTVQRHMSRLVWASYIEQVRTPRGYSIRVFNSRKWEKKRPDTSVQSEVSTQTGQKCPPRLGTSVHPQDKSDRSNIRESSCSKQLEKTEEEAPAGAVPRAASLPSFASALRELGTKNSIPQTIATRAQIDEQKRIILERYGNKTATGQVVAGGA